MKLRSSNPFWQVKDGLIESYSPLRENISCEILIIGAGVSGALVAYQLAEAGVRDLIIIDKRDAGFGSTSASTALVMYEIDTVLSRLIEMKGEREAVRSYELCLEAVSKIEAIVKKLQIDCAFKRRNSIYLSDSAKETIELRLESKARLAHGFKVRLLNRKQVEENFSFSRDAGLVSTVKDDAELDPLAFTYTLLHHVMRKGARIFTMTKASKFHHSHDGISVDTDRGYRIKARKIVFASGYETFHYLKRNIVKLKSTYAFVSEPVEDYAGWGYNKCLIWEAKRPYFYMRTTPDSRIMVGGKDEDFVNPHKRDMLIQKKARSLLNGARRMFPEIEMEIAYAWAGTFGETKDGLPYIGQNREFRNAYFALCYGANGTNFALIASEIIRDLYLGRSNTDASIFRFDR